MLLLTPNIGYKMLLPETMLAFGSITLLINIYKCIDKIRLHVAVLDKVETVLCLRII